MTTIESPSHGYWALAGCAEEGVLVKRIDGSPPNEIYAWDGIFALRYVLPDHAAALVPGSTSAM